MSDASKREEKQKSAIEKPKLDNAGRLHGIYFFDPDDGEVKDIMKNARRKVGDFDASRDALQNFIVPK